MPTRKKKKKIGHTKARRHNDIGPTRPAMARGPHSIYIFQKI